MFLLSCLPPFSLKRKEKQIKMSMSYLGTLPRSIYIDLRKPCCKINLQYKSRNSVKCQKGRLNDLFEGEGLQPIEFSTAHFSLKVDTT